GIRHKLNNSVYEFESEAGTFENRFEIVYGEDQTMGVGDLTSNGVLIYKNHDFIEISSELSPVNSVEIYDLSGKRLFSESGIYASICQINAKEFETQVLVIRVVTENGTLARKKIINN